MSVNHIKKVKEIVLKFPWGQIAGKWWGPENVRPILALHGWQDNAGTYDRLIPMLPDHVSYLALDFPGHGLSSHIPVGLNYSSFDFLHNLNMVCDHFKWDKISLMGHSMSSILSFILAAALPERVDMVIGFHMLKPINKNGHYIINDVKTTLNNGLLAYKRGLSNTEPPSYEYEELVERYCDKKALFPLSRVSAPHLLKRGSVRSRTDPNKFYFARDNRLKIMNVAQVPQAASIEMISNIIAPYCFIRSIETPFFDGKKVYYEAVAAMQKHNPKFELHDVEGDHHIHLSEPEKVSGIVSNFINKYRPPNEVH